MARKTGRPLKYRKLIRKLAKDTLYTPSSIALFAVECGFLDPSSETVTEEQWRIRIAMGRLSQYHKFPKEGDGLVFIEGQPARAGWYGQRWRSLLEDKA